jgi:heptosyltransferase-2
MSSHDDARQLSVAPARPKRLLLVLPSWVGDAVMATPAIAHIRAALPGACIGALARPGIDELLAGDSLIDEFHVGRATGIMSYKHLAAKLRPLRYDTVLLLTNSFSTALVVRLASIPTRVGFNRDARGLLLTHGVEPPRERDGSWGLISAVDYYWLLASTLLGEATPPHDVLLAHARAGKLSLPAGHGMRLALTPEASARATQLLTGAGLITSHTTGHAMSAGRAPRFAILNPGGNNPAKRWAAESFAQLADVLSERYGLPCIINGSPGERELCDHIARCCVRAKPHVLSKLAEPNGLRLSDLKAVIAHASLMVTNDTGPRHIACAFGVPVVSLFGPTDARWTTIPPSAKGGCEQVVVADPSLPASELANNHPERCAISRITLDRVVQAVERALAGQSSTPTTLPP